LRVGGQRLRAYLLGTHPEPRVVLTVSYRMTINRV
jgi:hypothetical protein